MPYKNKDYQKEYYQKNKDKIKKYILAHKEDRKEYMKERYQKNKEDIKNRNKKWRQDNKEYRKEWHYKKIYNLTLEEIDQILLFQNHKCILCGVSLIETKRCIDHDHKTGKVRGILCSKCNTGLGFLQYFYDNPDLLKKAIEYIKE